MFKQLKKPITQIIKQKTDEKINQLTRLKSISELEATDIFVASYPKSGKTWFQSMIAGLIYGLDLELSPDALVQDLVPDVHYLSYYKRYRTPMFAMTHDLPTPKQQKVVYLLRDGRDVMVSYFHFLRALHGQDVDFLALVQGEGIPCLWQDHVTSWLANPYQANLLIIKYEDLLTQPIPELKKFCNFVEVEREEEIIKKVIEQTSFSKMRQREIKQGWEDENWPKDKLFIRRGKSGSYRDEMPPAVLEKFLEKASPILEKFGYL